MITDVFPGLDVPLSQGFGCTPNPAEIPDPSCQGGYFHSGLDLAAPQGTAIVATRAGTVSQIGAGNMVWWQGAYVPALGPFAVVLTLDGGGQLAYGHVETNFVPVGARVAPGDRLGSVGSLGVSTGPHLHLEYDPQPGDLLTLGAADPTPYLRLEADSMALWLIVGVDSGKVWMTDGMRKWYVPDPNSLADLQRVFGVGQPVQVGSDTENAIPNA